MRFIFTSTTSAFGARLLAAGGPARGSPRTSRRPARHLRGHHDRRQGSPAKLVSRDHGLPASILRTSRASSPRPTSSAEVRDAYDWNAKANEILHRRVEIEDAVAAHLVALERAPFARFPEVRDQRQRPPLTRDDLQELRADALGWWRACSPPTRSSTGSMAGEWPRDRARLRQRPGARAGLAATLGLRARPRAPGPTVRLAGERSWRASSGRRATYGGTIRARFTQT